MADVAVGDIVEVTFEGRLFGQQVMSKLHYRCGSIVGGVLTQADMATEMHAKFIGVLGLYTAYRACLPTQWIGQDNWYQVVKPTRYVAYKKLTLGDGGLSTFAATAPNVATCVTSRGDLAGRRYVKTTHIPSPTEDGWIIEGTLQPFAVTALANFKSKIEDTVSLVNGGRTADFAPVIYHRTGTPGGWHTFITNSVVQLTSRVMRRRTLFIGS